MRAIVSASYKRTFESWSFNRVQICYCWFKTHYQMPRHETVELQLVATTANNHISKSSHNSNNLKQIFFFHGKDTMQKFV